MRIRYTLNFLIAMLLVLGRSAAQESTTVPVVPDSTASKTKLDVEQLNFQPSEAEDVLLASNPFQGMETTVERTGFSLEPVDGSKGWHIGFEVLGHGRNSASLTRWLPRSISHKRSEAFWRSPSLTAHYQHGVQGLRQNFIVQHAPTGNGVLRVEQRITTNLQMLLAGSDRVVFISADGQACATYDELLVWDADGDTLDAALELDGDILAIVVNDADARYPITIDPISSTPNRLLTGPVSTQEFGISVATAGDLNGDGYSDVVIGAWQTTLGQANEGAAYIYYGTVNGIGAAASIVLQSDQIGAQFGCSVSTAGDVNNDGFSDLIVGARTWESSAAENNEGGAFVYHGSATGISAVPAVILQPNHVSDNFGSNVACAGDINNDGYSDLMVGAYLADYGSGQEGVVFIYLGTAGGVNPVAVHRLERNVGFAHFGRSIAGCGDVNGDGYSDVIIGAPDWFNVNADAGTAFIYWGSAAALGAAINPIFDQQLFGSTLLDGSFGWSVTCAGDLNGDGYSDVAVGAYYDNIGGQAQEGTVWVFHGAAAGLNTVAAVVLQNNITTGWLGRAVSTAGDMNGDGYADLLVGAPLSESGQVDEGLVYLYFGSPTGISATANMTFQLDNAGANFGESVYIAGDVNGDGYSDMILGARIYGTSGAAAIYHGGPYNVNPTASGTRAGGAMNAELGWSVAQAGDVNGDGYADALIGAPQADNGQAGEGLVYVHMGSAAGLSMVPALTLEANIGSAQFGFSVGTAGDVNGDGYADVIVGAPLSNNLGRAYVYLGSPAGLSAVPSRTYTGGAASGLGYSVGTAGDINADGYSEVLVGAPDIVQVSLYMGSATGLPAAPTLSLTQGAVGTLFGHCVNTAGDVNGDGYSDIIVTARNYSNGQANEGAAFVYHGSVAGLVTPFATLLEPNLASSNFGVSASGAGDVNGDGYFDVVVGADMWESGQADEGAAFVYYGAAAGLNAAAPTIFQRNVVNARVGKAVSEGGDVNGDGYADIVVGAPTFENGAQLDEGLVFVVRGSSTGLSIGSFDQLEVNGAGYQMGYAVAGGGDVDGDGYSDVITGAPFANPTLATEGTCYWFRGNLARSIGRQSRQYLSDLVSPLSVNSQDYGNPTFFGIGHRTRSSIQRTDARLVWEVVFEGQPFSGNPITNSLGSTGSGAVWTDLGVVAPEIKELIYKNAGYIRYKWRVRVEYELAKLIDGQRFSRWFYGYANGWGDIGVLPIELVDFSGHVEGAANRLYWTTATEASSAYFDVQRSTDGSIYTSIGSVNAAGNSQETINYSFDDMEPPQRLAYYRLRMVDLNGAMELSDAIAIDRTGSGMLVFPNPAQGSITLAYGSIGEEATINVLDATGRVVRTSVVAGNTISSNLDIDGLPSGHYTVSLVDGSGNIVDKAPFLKQ
ncbi:MAG: FG-GAP repeat protein [Flavobacteriales bacterium]|nr:FG-GAP repeat protein [Flavobacteriales bacterium]